LVFLIQLSKSLSVPAAMPLATPTPNGRLSGRPNPPSTDAPSCTHLADLEKAELKEAEYSDAGARVCSLEQCDARKLSGRCLQQRRKLISGKHDAVAEDVATPIPSPSPAPVRAMIIYPASANPNLALSLSPSPATPIFKKLPELTTDDDDDALHTCQKRDSTLLSPR
jgi:hypothetical protein